MHPDPRFHDQHRARCDALVAQVGFGMVFAATPEGPRVVHAPLIPSGDGLVQFHLSRRNLIAPHLAGATVLCLVNGPDAYISPRWYSDRSQVPTWNYVSVELEGPLREISEDELRAQLATLVATNEARLPEGTPWTFDQAPAGDVDAMIQQIVGFELTVRERRATFKLSQNKPEGERARVAEGLEHAGAPAVAQWMRSTSA